MKSVFLVGETDWDHHAILAAFSTIEKANAAVDILQKRKSEFDPDYYVEEFIIDEEVDGDVKRI
jgi:hypothetical protein